MTALRLAENKKEILSFFFLKILVCLLKKKKKTTKNIEFNQTCFLFENLKHTLLMMLLTEMSLIYFLRCAC